MPKTEPEQGGSGVSLLQALQMEYNLWRLRWLVWLIRVRWAVKSLSLRSKGITKRIHLAGVVGTTVASPIPVRGAGNGSPRAKSLPYGRLTGFQGWGIIAFLVLLLLVTSTWLSATPKEVTLLADGQLHTVATRAATVGAFLAEAGISLGEKDWVKPSLGDPLAAKTTVDVLRAVDLELSVGGEMRVVSVPLLSLQDILTALGEAPLNQKDQITTNLPWLKGETPTLLIDRVVTRKVVERVEIQPTTRGKPDPGLSRGQRRTVQPGQTGILERTVEITEVNGVETSREVLDTTTLRPAVDRVMTFGSRQGVGAAYRGEIPANARGPLLMEATAYTHTGNPTATGIYPFEGIVAVDPRVIPLGTLLYIEGYGYAEAQDTGGLIKGNIIDVFMDTAEKARQWGRRKVNVYIVD